MANGKIKWFNPKKGYGFIEPEDGDKDVFIHISALEKAGIKFLSDNQKSSDNDAKLRLSSNASCSIFPIRYYSYIPRNVIVPPIVY